MIWLIDLKKKVKKLFQQCFLAFAESEWSAGDYFQLVQSQIGRASFVLDLNYQNIAGVKLPSFISREDEF